MVKFATINLAKLRCNHSSTIKGLSIVMKVAKMTSLTAKKGKWTARQASGNVNESESVELAGLKGIFSGRKTSLKRCQEPTENDFCRNCTVQTCS